AVCSTLRFSERLMRSPASIASIQCGMPAVSACATSSASASGVTRCFDRSTVSPAAAKVSDATRDASRANSAVSGVAASARAAAARVSGNPCVTRPIVAPAGGPRLRALIARAILAATPPSPTDSMRILLSNDDGYFAPGLEHLAAALKAHAEVTVVAPERDRSGASNSLTLDRPLMVRRAPSVFLFVNGTPTDCVHLAVTGLLDTLPDMVISGINDGANMGDDTIYSGT